MGIFASETICSQLANPETATHHGLKLLEPTLEQRQSTQAL